MSRDSPFGVEKPCISLLSAGLDSSIALALAIKEGFKPICLTFDYGQRSALREMGQARKIADHFELPHRVWRLTLFETLRNSGALLQKETSLPHPTSLDERAVTEQSAKAVWVPNRNGVFLETAAALAEDEGIDRLVVGFNREEAATFSDNSVAYLDALNQAFQFSTRNKVKVISPTAEMDKTEIVAAAIQLRFPLELVWSCYEGKENMCGECESCQRLKRALLANGVSLSAYF